MEISDRPRLLEGLLVENRSRPVVGWCCWEASIRSLPYRVQAGLKLYQRSHSMYPEDGELDEFC